MKHSLLYLFFLLSFALQAQTDIMCTQENTLGITGSGSKAQVDQYTAKGVTIAWDASASKYAYDTAEGKPKELKAKYPTVKDADGNTVSISYKAVPNNQTDELAAKVTFTDESLRDNQIIFKTLNTGSQIEAVKTSGTNYKLTVHGTMDYAEEDIIAVLMPKDTTQKQQVINSFKLVHLEAKTINVALVATDDVSKSKLDSIVTQTNAIWNKAGVTINFIKDEQVFDIAPYLEGSSTILTEKNTLLSTYSSMQQAINKAYGNSERYVLFVSSKPSSTGQMGYMRLNGQFGYVFGSVNQKTAAHELGHGVFNLEHTWEQYKTGEGTTGLLMDYANGNELTHLDWKQINDPKLKLYAFQGQDDGMAVIPKGVLIEGKANYAMTGGMIIELENVTIIPSCGLNNKNLLYRFKDSSGKIWVADIALDQTNPTISSYINEKNRDEEYPKKTHTLISNEVVMKVNFDKETSKLTIHRITFGVVNSDVRGSSYSDVFRNASSYNATKIKEEVPYKTSIVDDPCGKSTTQLARVLSNLKSIASNSRSNQNIELEYWEGDKLKVYTLKDGKLQEVDKPLSDSKIETGDWTGGQETSIRYTLSKDGVVQVKAFGFRKDMKLAPGKEDTRKNLPSLSKHIKDQTNKFLLENNVKNFDKEAKFENPEETFADGGHIIIGGSYTKIISEGIGVTTNLLKTGEFEEDVYLSSTEKKTTIHAPGLLTGSSEVIAQKVTDLTSIATLAYDMAVDKEARSEMWKQLGGIKDQMGEEPGEFLPVMGEILLSVTTGNTTEDFKIIADENADAGKRSHLATRGAGNAVITAMSGAALVKSLPEIGDKLTDWVKKIKKARGNIRKVLDTDLGKAYLKKYFDKFVNQGNFEEWFEMIKKFRKGELNFDIHHIISMNILENNKELQRILNKFGFDTDKFNGIDNAIPVQRRSLDLDLNGHSNHPQYDRFIESEINKITTRADLTDFEKFELIQKRINDMKNKIETDVLLGNKNVNNITSW